jgi:hypothetical protein
MHAGLVTLDVRPEMSLLRHLPGALNIPLNELTARLSELDLRRDCRLLSRRLLRACLRPSRIARLRLQRAMEDGLEWLRSSGRNEYLMSEGKTTRTDTARVNCTASIPAAGLFYPLPAEFKSEPELLFGVGGRG